ncbi:DUF4349 domain-containing protein [Streptomyces sp. SPB78]|uniref:DUF4349 domain-containing protein n=1 Tax=Streptomyces sp. (strain SPB78) TaxID=591157 RepID=UPI0001B55495|nr:DUF4349 domain-containing protein [Streptomyces sp. SPB78]
MTRTRGTGGDGGRYGAGRAAYGYGARGAGGRARLLAVLALPLTAVLVLGGCTAGGGADSAGSNAKRAVADGASGARSGADGAKSGGGAGRTTKADAPTPKGPHLIRTATLRVRVKDVAEEADRARTAAADAGGFVSEETTTGGGGERARSRLTLRVPVDSFDAVHRTLSDGPGRLLDDEVRSQDVSSQVVDVDSRVRTMRASVNRIRALMDDATKIADVTALESELSTREADLESLLAQQAGLRDRTALSTLTLTVEGPGAPPEKKKEKKDDTSFGDALAGGWHALTATVRVIGVVLGALLPFLAVAAVVLLAAWAVRGRVRGRWGRTGSTADTPDTTSIAQASDAPDPAGTPDADGGSESPAADTSGRDPEPPARP